MDIIDTIDRKDKIDKMDKKVEPRLIAALQNYN